MMCVNCDLFASDRTLKCEPQVLPRYRHAPKIITADSVEAHYTTIGLTASSTTALCIPSFALRPPDSSRLLDNLRL